MGAGILPAVDVCILASMMKLVQKRSVILALSAVLVSMLLAKYFWSLFLFPGVPFGYDAGIYRYLFLKHAQAFPPFFVAPLPPWAASHPLGLFFFSGILIRLGMSPDMLIGWMWNCFPVLLFLVLAVIFGRKHGMLTGLCILLVALLSTVQYQGFLMMYWKVFAAFLWCVLAFFTFERRSKLWMLFGMLTIATHQQVGLLFVVAVLASILTQHDEHRIRLRQLLQWFATLVLGLLWYIPNGRSAILGLLPMLSASLFSLVSLGILVFAIGLIAIVTFFPRHGHFILLLACGVLGGILLLFPLTGIAPDLLGHLFQRPDAIPGAFFTIPDYLEQSLPLLLLGMFGLFLSFRNQKGTVWQWAAIFSGVAVLSMFFFYRRFILPLDFFLLPFAALALSHLWNSRGYGLRILGGVLVLVQASFALTQIQSIDPHVERGMLDDIAALQNAVEPNTQVIVLDVMAPWVVGYLPENAVSGPGIFDSQPKEAWEKFLYGSDTERSAFISHYPKGTYFFVTDVFRSYYPPEAQTLLLHSCLQSTQMRGLFRSVCG